MPRKNEIIERDRGWKRIRGQLAKAKKHGVRVGVLGPEQRAEGTADMLTIALANEFGTDTIPERSFIRAAYDNRRRELTRTKERLWDLIVAGKIDVDRALAMLGEAHVAHIQQYMRDLSDPANEESTVAQKGSDNPLIDTRQLSRSIAWEKYGA